MHHIIFVIGALAGPAVYAQLIAWAFGVSPFTLGEVIGITLIWASCIAIYLVSAK